MDYRSNSIAEIQKKYAGCNLLMPATTEVQLNPFYKITVSEVLADVSENSGDIFKVGSVKVGKDGNGKDIWEDTFSPTKPLLMKIAVAAGIQFDPDRTYGPGGREYLQGKGVRCHEASGRHRQDPCRRKGHPA